MCCKMMEKQTLEFSLWSQEVEVFSQSISLDSLKVLTMMLPFCCCQNYLKLLYSSFYFCNTSQDSDAENNEMNCGNLQSVVRL